MKIPYAWLKDYVSVDLDPEALAHRLTMAGLEVDRVEYPWPDIITAEIIWLDKIAGSDHLSATRIWTGSEELSVVCGAPNIQLHDKVPLAQIGARVGEITIAEKKAMGVLSQGMLCSPRELGISDDHRGILILPPDTPVGMPLGKLLGADQAVIELDIKAHRGDLFCMVGVAREVAAFTGKSLQPPNIVVQEQGPAASKLMKLEVRDADLCPRYTARVIRNVTIGPSPRWMAERLTAAGMRPINNVVDVTNYVMLELGQPLHAFDYDKVADHTIIVRRADASEELTTLDGVTRKLTPEMLLITDPTGPNVIAGIFGGERVEVGAGTTNVLLEAAHFNPVNIRRTSVALGLRTESSGRFEKNPDIELTSIAIDRAAQLLVELAGGSAAPGRVDFYPDPVHQRTLPFRIGQVEWLTGMEVTRGEAIDALRTLEFGVVEEGDGEVVRVTIPTWRHDVDESADLVEEVARIVGYDRIPSLLPTGPLPAFHRDEWFEREQTLRDILAGEGLSEVLTYTLTSRQRMARLLLGAGSADEQTLLAPAPGQPTAHSEAAVLAGQPSGRSAARRQTDELASRLRAVTIRNPLSVELDALRLTLMAGLLDTVAENAKHEDAGLWFFELGRRYLPTPELASGDGLAAERRTLGIVLCGPLAQGWLGEARDADFYDLKGILATLLAALHVERYRFEPAQHPTFHPGRCARLEVALIGAAASDESGDSAALARDAAWIPTAVLGEVHPEVAQRYDLPHRAYLLELDLERLYGAVPERITQRAVPRYPTADRDLAIVVAQDAAEAAVAEIIRAAGGELLRVVRLFDVYTGEGIPAGKKGLAYALSFQSPERTLTDAEVERAQAGIVAALRARAGAELRA